MSLTQEQWQKVVDRGPLIPPFYKNPQEYKFFFDNSRDYIQDIFYHDQSFSDNDAFAYTAWHPNPAYVGVFNYHRVDEDTLELVDDPSYVDVNSWHNPQQVLEWTQANQRKGSE